MAPELKNLIRKTWSQNPPDGESLTADASFDDFYKESFSFYNGLMIEAIQTGESVLGFEYQPEIRERWLRIFSRKIFPQTVIALTNKQMVLLQEDLKYQSHHEWIFTFIPIYRLSSLDKRDGKGINICSLNTRPKLPYQRIEIMMNFEEA